MLAFLVINFFKSPPFTHLFNVFYVIFKIIFIRIPREHSDTERQNLIADPHLERVCVPWVRVCMCERACVTAKRERDR